MVALVAPVQAQSATDGRVTPGVEIRHTTDGIPHVRAANWHDLGYGVGYAQAQDALCTLGEAFVTFEGRRSYFFGPDARPDRNSIFGKPKNVELDLFFRAFADAQLVAEYRRQQPQELNETIAGFAAGYNRYLRDARQARFRSPRRGCLREPWVREISPDDLYRRMFAAGIAAGYARFIPEIVNAQPAAQKAAGAGGPATLRAKLENRVGDQVGLGSNMIAFGRQAVGEEGAVLFGNPHWYWGGPDRFYQVHLTIPGKLDVAGVSFLGIPVIMIGFNEHVAWSHTVSGARRFGLFDLALEPGHPARYRYDGVSEPMQAVTVSVEARGEDGVTRTLYRTPFGPVVDLGGHDPAFGWGTERASAMRDVNADNFRIFRNYFYWNQARSLDEFIAIQRREAAIPWVNTVAIGRGDGRVWYGDVGAVPNVPDALRGSCATALAKRFAGIDPLTPFLDGSRSVCGWRVDEAAAQPGAMPSGRMPSLLRGDYVANMNDSYWLSNARQPLAGYPSVLGGERHALSLRGRFGHRLALSLVQGKLGSSLALSRRLMREVLTPRAYSAELFKDELLAGACAQREVVYRGDPWDEEGLGRGAQKNAPSRKVNIAQACRVLRRWPNTANAQDRGALLWDAFWARLEKIPPAEFYKVPYSADAPLETPRDPNAADPRVAQALAVAVLAISAKGWALDAPLGSQLFARSHGQQVPLYGGCHRAGYFTVACNDDGGYRMGPSSHANSYVQVVRFDRQGVEAHTLLAHGQEESAVDNGAGEAPVKRYARKAWLRFPFHEQEIARDPALKRLVLRL